MYHRYGKCSKISNSFLVLFSNKIKAFIKAGTSKMLVSIANRENLDQTAFSSLEAV